MTSFLESYPPIPEVFNIYTTGIANWCDFNQFGQNLIIEWNNGISKNLIDKIPDKFNIAIRHYDPLLKVDKKVVSIEGNDRIDYKDYIFENLVKKDYQQSSRIVLCEFLDQKINLNQLHNPYFIIDFAHLYKYPYLIGNIIVSNNYYDENKTTIPINALRFGFIGNHKIGRYVGKSNLIKIYDSGQIKTYIDKMIERNDPFENYEPVNYLEMIYDKIIIEIERIVKELKPDKNGLPSPLYKVKHITKKITLNTQKIINKLLDLIWDNTKVKNIIESISQNIIEENIEIITNEEILNI